MFELCALKHRFVLPITVQTQKFNVLLTVWFLIHSPGVSTARHRSTFIVNVNIAYIIDYISLGIQDYNILIVSHKFMYRYSCIFALFHQNGN